QLTGADRLGGPANEPRHDSALRERAEITMGRLFPDRARPRPAPGLELNPVAASAAAFSSRRGEAGPVGAIALSACVAVAVCHLAPALAQDCSPLKPSKPVDTEVADKTKADANVLLRSL